MGVCCRRSEWHKPLVKCCWLAAVQCISPSLHVFNHALQPRRRLHVAVVADKPCDLHAARLS